MHRSHDDVVDLRSKMASNSVYKYNFLAEPDSALVCVKCLEVAEEPRQHEKCGRLLCSECLEKHGRNKPCPNCREPRPQYFADNRSKREIKALGVRCSNVDRGCEWVGTVDTLKEHLASCEFTLVPCPKQCKDANEEVQHFMRRDLATHLEEDCPNRDYACQDCGEKGTYATITEEHDTVCKKKIIPCRNAKCALSMERQQVDEHVENQCLYTVLSCKYEGIGCSTQLERKDMAAHEENDGHHLRMALDTVNRQQNKLDRLEKEIKCPTVTLNKRDSESMTFAYQKKKETDEVFTSPSFYTHPNGYLMEVRVYANGIGQCKGTHMTFVAQQLSDAGLFSGKITIELLNQLEDNRHFKEILIHLTDTPKQNIWATFTPHSALALDRVKNTQYLKDNTLYFRVSVEVPDHKPWLHCTAK